MTTWIIIGVLALIILWAIAKYNSIVRAKITIDNAWSDISVFLKKRFDLIPNLVNTVKGYAQHESQTLEKVIQARNAAIAVPSGDVSAMAAANQQLGGALRGLLAIAENYPDLKANSQFLELQNTLQQIESELASSRRYYNATVRDFNTTIQVFPGNLVASMAGFQPRAFFELDDQAEAKNVEVKF